MNALCSGGISVSTTRVSTLSASRRVSKRSCNERWIGPYNRLISHLPTCRERRACRGRDASYLAPPAQIRTCSFPAYGSHPGYPRQLCAAVCEPFRGSITHPTQPLCTLRVRRYRRLTQHSLPGDLLGLTWAGLAPADRASFAGAFRHSITSSASAKNDSVRLSALAILRLVTG
jgi:hypothetical protein